MFGGVEVAKVTKALLRCTPAQAFHVKESVHLFSFTPKILWFKTANPPYDCGKDAGNQRSKKTNSFLCFWSILLISYVN